MQICQILRPLCKFKGIKLTRERFLKDEKKKKLKQMFQGVPKKIVDSELFTPGDDNNTQQQYSTSGPIFGPFRDKLHPFLSIFLEKCPF